MNTNKLIQHHDVRFKILRAMLFFSILSGGLALVINAINQRPLVNLIFPAVICLLMAYLLYLLQKKGHYQGVKLVAIFFLCVIYIPFAWLTSPGSMSAMPFYSLLIMVFGLILVDDTWELIFPLVSLLEMLVMIQLEWLFPHLLMVYDDMKFRAMDISANLLVVCLILFLILYMLNRNYKESFDQVYRLSIVDPLTNLYNRRYMLNALKSVHNVASRTGEPYCLLLIDINHFKKVNDAYGHGVGDQVLIKLAEILQESSRNYDICCRYGGDEFLVILPNSDYDASQIYGERITMAFNTYAKTLNKVDFSLSIGITTNGKSTLEQMIEIADDRLYQKKGRA